jgi:hypothetical protein
MQHYPTIAAEVEDTYRRERTAAQLHGVGGRSHLSNRVVVSRARWYRRRDRAGR